MKKVLVLVLVSIASSLFTNLPGYTEYCFFIDGKAGQKIWGEYVISGEGDMNVLTRFFDSVKKPKYSSPKGTREGKFEFLLTNDEYHELCFKALDADVKVISFEFSQEDQVSTLAAEDHFQPIEDEVKMTSRLLETVYRNLHFYERRERVHRDLTERTCDNILRSVLVKVVVLCGISLVQIYVLRGLFSSDKVRV
jgi:hypothetical protein